MDIIAHKVIASCRRCDECDKAWLMGIYATKTCETVQSDIEKALALRVRQMQPLMPCGESWWGSDEQVVYLKVMRALLDFDGDAAALVVLCPGPWRARDLRRIERLRRSGYDLATIAECVLVGCRWCRMWQSSIPDIPTKVAARIAAKSAGMFMTSGRVRAALAQVEEARLTASSRTLRAAANIP